MSQITFKGWLKKEIGVLAPGRALRPSSLSAAAEENPRLMEYAVLYLLETDGKVAPGTCLCKEYNSLRGSYTHGGSFVSEEAIPARYRKALSSWRARRDQAEHIDASKRSRLAANKRLQEQTGIRVAQMSRDLGINKGNLNAYFKHSDVSKLSLDTATKVFRYLEEKSL